MWRMPRFASWHDDHRAEGSLSACRALRNAPAPPPHLPTARCGSAAGHLLSAAKDVSSAGQDALGLYDQVRGNGSKLFHNDTVSLSELSVVTRNADGMVAKMDRAERQLRAVHAAGWEPSVGAARD